MDPTRLLTGDDEIVATADFDFDRLAGSMLFTLGCHAGLNLPDRYLGAGADDWAETARGPRGLRREHRLRVRRRQRRRPDRAAALALRRQVGGKQTAGQALMFAKQAYLGGLGLYTNYDEKILMEATFYGLPCTASRTRWPTRRLRRRPRPHRPGDGAGLGPLSTRPRLHTRTVDGQTYTVVDGEDPQVTPDRPILPRTTAYVGVPGRARTTP